MKRTCLVCLTFTMVGLSLLAATDPASADIVAYGEVTDSPGTDGGGWAPLDLTFGSVAITSTGDAIFTARYGSGFDPATTLTSFALDLDRDPLTGDPWCGMGLDAHIGVYGTDFQGMAYYWTPGLTRPYPMLPATYLADGVQVTVPLSTLGGGDGLMHFNVATAYQLTTSSSTGICDYMPDREGFAYGAVGVGVVEPVVPVPGAALLGVLGLSAAGVKLRRRLA